MNKFALLVLLLLPTYGLAQRVYPPPPKKGDPLPSDKDYECADKANKCRYHFRYNAKQRSAFFPFNQAMSVRLISFEFHMPHTSPIVDNSTADDRVSKINDNDGPVFSAIKPGEFVVDYSQVKESKNLSKAGVDSLTDILYNVGYTPLKCSIYNADPGYACYEPRNAILFLDANGKVTQYIKLCFTCHRYYYSSSKIKAVEYCDDKYKLLARFFAKQGVVFGTKPPVIE